MSLESGKWACTICDLMTAAHLWRYCTFTEDTENNLQKAAHKLNQIITEHGLTVSVQKTEWIAFEGRDPLRTKTAIDNKIIEQVNLFNYLRNMISYEGELDIDNKLNKFLKITGVLNKGFRPQKNS